MSLNEQCEAWLTDGGPAALVIRDHLVPVEGPDGVFFPAGFAPQEGATKDPKKFQGGYNIDYFPDGGNVRLVDSVGSQANRIEPLFARDRYKGLVPQVVIAAGTQTVNLLDPGHRAGDAVVRCTPLQTRLREAFKAAQAGDDSLLAKVAPTSLVFGVWDSRDTQAKRPRLLASTIRAYNVRRLSRSAQYNPPVSYADEELVEEPEDLKDAEGKIDTKHPFAKRGYAHVPASASHGGVIATGGIRRDATLSLAALRLLRAGADPAATATLQRYILGLSLVALTATPANYLRQGCNLVPDLEQPRQFVLVHADGKRDPIDLSHEAAEAYARAAAAAFGVGENRSETFSKQLAKEDLAKEGGGKPKKVKTKAVKEGK